MYRGIDSARWLGSQRTRPQAPGVFPSVARIAGYVHPQVLVINNPTVTDAPNVPPPVRKAVASVEPPADDSMPAMMAMMIATNTTIRTTKGLRPSDEAVVLTLGCAFRDGAALGSQDFKQPRTGQPQPDYPGTGVEVEICRRQMLNANASIPIDASPLRVPLWTPIASSKSRLERSWRHTWRIRRTTTYGLLPGCSQRVDVSPMGRRVS